MPIVFVHGVNNRQENIDYQENLNRISIFLKNIFAPILGLDSSKISIFFPYWGVHGVKFKWNQASLPSNYAVVESLNFGAPSKNSDDFELWAAESYFQHEADTINFGQISRAKGFQEAIYLIWDTASLTTPPTTDAYTDIIKAFFASLNYANKNPAPHWAMQEPTLSNKDFFLTLLDEIKTYGYTDISMAYETFSLNDRFQSIKETISRLGSIPSNIASSFAIEFGRKTLHEKASCFLGDIFIYLSQRGDKYIPGPIVQTVIEDLCKAEAAKCSGDDKLIIIGHSLGGVITYDTLTYFKPTTQVDILLTIGSQVALFEEMSLYRISRDDIPSNPPQDRITQPKNILKWLNVFDANDIFSFKAESVFDGPNDFRFNTGYGLLQSHSGYFARPSFYERLAKRLL